MKTRLVLVADNHAPWRVGVRLTLEQEGYRVVEAAGAAETIASAARERPEVCLVDLGMPGGLAAVEGMYRHDPQIKIVVFTRSIDARDVFDSVRAGAIGYLVKGIDDNALVQAVDAVIRGESALPLRFARLLMGLPSTGGDQKSDRSSGGHARLTPRQAQVLEYLREGLRTREIAERLGLSPITVRVHISALLHKLDEPTREAALAALDAAPAWAAETREATRGDPLRRRPRGNSPSERWQGFRLGSTISPGVAHSAEEKNG